MDFLVSLGARLPSCKNCRSGAAPCNAHPWAALIGAIRSQDWSDCPGSGRIASPFLQYTIVNAILQKEKLKTLQRRTLRGYSCKIFGDYRSAGTLHIYPHNSIREWLYGSESAITVEDSRQDYSGQHWPNGCFWSATSKDSS